MLKGEVMNQNDRSVERGNIDKLAENAGRLGHIAQKYALEWDIAHGLLTKAGVPEWVPNEHGGESDSLVLRLKNLLGVKP